MPLKISLKANEKIIVNGAVMQNGDNPAQLLFHNEVSLLREKDILTEEQGSTPARRVYYALQCLYLFPAKAEIFLPAFYTFLSEFVEAAPSAGELVAEIRSEAEQGRLYQALRKSRRLIEREEEILHAFATSRDI